MKDTRCQQEIFSQVKHPWYQLLLCYHKEKLNNDGRLLPKRLEK